MLSVSVLHFFPLLANIFFLFFVLRFQMVDPDLLTGQVSHTPEQQLNGEL